MARRGGGTTSVVTGQHPCIRESLRGSCPQLTALEFETTESGTIRIAVPERAGNDDLAMALFLAAHHQAPTARGGALRLVVVTDGPRGATDDLLEIGL